ncbi:MAG: hypothetical protein RL071_2549 [Pseudomonadota bacterium]|jgi:pilus assembly protein CpaB
MQRQQTGGRLKASLFLAGAFVVAGLTSYLVLEVINRAEQKVELAKQLDKDTVVVAKNDLVIGLPITEDDVTAVDVLPGTVPLDRVYSDPSVLVGQTPRERIYAGETIRQERLARRDAGLGLNAIISPGKRAMTIETDTQSHLAGFLKPGNWVDIIVTIRPDDKDVAAKWVTETILQDVRVLGVGDSLGEAPEAADDKAGGKKKKERTQRSRTRPSITLELTPEESERLALAASKGDLHVVLRSDIDKLLTETGVPMSTVDLLGIAAAEPPPPPPTAAAMRAAPKAAPAATPLAGPPPRSVVTAEVIEGTTTTSVGFDDQGQKVETGDSKRRR